MQDLKITTKNLKQQAYEFTFEIFRILNTEIKNSVQVCVHFHNA